MGPAFDQPEGAQRLHWCIADLLAHGWDLARATGQPAELPEDPAEQALASRWRFDHQRGQRSTRHLRRHARSVYNLLFSLPGTLCSATARRSAWAKTSGTGPVGGAHADGRVTRARRRVLRR